MTATSSLLLCSGGNTGRRGNSRAGLMVVEQMLKVVAVIAQRRVEPHLTVQDGEGIPELAWWSSPWNGCSNPWPSLPSGGWTLCPSLLNSDRVPRTRFRLWPPLWLTGFPMSHAGQGGARSWQLGCQQGRRGAQSNSTERCSQHTHGRRTIERERTAQPAN